MEKPGRWRKSMISVIVPVFRVEKFLEKCIQSVLKQTYGDFELILVDDGSDDNCPAICDRYAKEDERIKVIHKQNGGIGDTRNAGLQIAQGEYITFVDSDDYIHPQMLEMCMKSFQKEPDIDIAMCPFEKVEEEDNRAYEAQKEVKESYQLFSHIEIIQEMFAADYEAYIVSWNKVYKRKLFEGILFPVGKIHEDIFTTYKLLYNAKALALMDEKMYYYRQRVGSAMSAFHVKGYYDDLEAINERLQFFSAKEKKEYAFCVNRSLEHLLMRYKEAKANGEKELAGKIKDTFLIEWKKVKNNKQIVIPKERRVYFNSYLIGDSWAEFYMPIYWKMISLQRKMRKK